MYGCLCVSLCVCRQRQDRDIAATMQSDELRVQEELRKRQVCVADSLVVMSSLPVHVIRPYSFCHTHFLSSKRTWKWQLKYRMRRVWPWLLAMHRELYSLVSPLLHATPSLPSPPLTSPYITYILPHCRSWPGVCKNMRTRSLQRCDRGRRSKRGGMQSWVRILVARMFHSGLYSSWL